MAARVISDESWIFSQSTDTKHFDILCQVIWKHCCLIHFPVFLAVKQYSFLTVNERSAIKVFPQIWTFSALLIITFQSLFKQKMFLMHVCIFFQIRDIEFPS